MKPALRVLMAIAGLSLLAHLTVERALAHDFEETVKLTASDGGATDFFGASVSLDGLRSIMPNRNRLVILHHAIFIFFSMDINLPFSVVDHLHRKGAGRLV